MAKHNKFKKTLFFLEGNVATEAEIEASMEFEPGVQFRNAALHNDSAAIETFDRLAGAVPDRYRDAERAKAGEDAPDGGDAMQEAPTGDAGPPQRPAAAPKPPTPAPGNGWSGNS
jgi:hypothetical protein